MKLDIQMFADGKVVIETDLSTKNFENGLDRMKNATNKAGNTIKNIVVGLGITKVIGAAINQINASLDTAIARSDTLNNFPKVMSNLGIGAKEAEESIKKMSDKLMGLPTTLDAGARAVQRFTSKNSDVKKSTDLFLALNNAILAGGAGAEIQSSALEQLSQAYAKGKPDMMEWRTAMMAMPAQLKQVAIAMNYVDADALGEALREGTVSMDEFMETIMKLNSQGLDGFKNFEEQAKNSTAGIQTAVTNMKSRIATGVADIIDALNVRFEETGMGSLADFIAGLGTKVKESLSTLGQLIKGEITTFEFGQEVANIIVKFVNKINDNIYKVVDVGIQTLLSFTQGIIQTIPELVAKVPEIIKNLCQAIIDNFQDILDTGLETAVKLAEGLEDGIPDIIESTIDIINKILNELQKPETISKIWEAGTKIVISIAIGMIKAIPTLLTQGPDKIKTEITNSLLQLPSKMIQIGGNIVSGVWEGIKAKAGDFGKKIQNWASGILSTIKKTLGIHSPSRVFRDQVGSMMALGIGVGFEDEITDVYKQMQKALDIENSKINSNIELGNANRSISQMISANASFEGTIPVQVDLDGEQIWENQQKISARKSLQYGGVR